MKIQILVVSVFASAAQGFTSLSARPKRSVALKMSQQPESAQRQPWDALRFIQQSSKFVRVAPFAPRVEKRVIQPGDVLWEPSSKEFTMSPLDDVVMGGASTSQFNQETGLWTGKVTDANNGGFVGIRSTPAFSYDMEQCQGIEVKVRGGNGKRFKFVLRDSTDFNGVCWSTSATLGGTNPAMALFSPKTSGETTIRIPFDKQIPTIFAKTVPDQTFLKSNVVGFQVAYSKFEYDGELNPNFELGDVSLQIMEIRAY